MADSRLQTARGVYWVIKQQFGVESWVDLIYVGTALGDAGIDRKAFGHKKLIGFIEFMAAARPGFMETRLAAAGAGTKRELLIHDVPEWNCAPQSALPTQAPVAAATPAPAPAPSPTPTVATTFAPQPSPVPSVSSKFGTDFDYVGVARTVAASPNYVRFAVPSEVRSEFDDVLFRTVFVPQKIKNIVAMAAHDSANVDDLLNQAWKAAFEEGALRYYEGKVIFPLPVMRADGETPVEISLARNERFADSLPWFVTYVDTAVRTHAPRSVAPSRAIEEFAYFGHWETFLANLAALALPEEWSFGDDGSEQQDRRYPILKSYISNIFYRLKQEDKICESADGRFAAFNTGLVNRRYDDIYLCFERNLQSERCPWKFVDFCTQGVGRWGKQLVSQFNPLPQTAQFFDRKEDLLFDTDAELVINYDHVLADNVNRLPVDFIKEGMRGDAAATRLLDEVADASEFRRREIYDEVRTRLEADHIAFRYLRTRLDDAVTMACKRIRWNYKTAIPMYYPRANTMSLLLPLCLMDESVADAALVVEHMESGNYQGQTVLTMQMAYQDARLVCRPDSDWLTTSAKAAGEDEE